jgi:hypothetical protein
MPLITAQSVRNDTAATVTLTTLDGSTDTFAANGAIYQALLLVNTTGAPVVLSMIGDKAPATHKCQGYPPEAVVALSVTVPANATVTQYVNTAGNVLAGTTTITGGVGVNAALLNLS